ncbi:MAG: hypothetical protein EZS28_006575 [Streblomastix strix]|uniref:Uncharacterized protein n=1 Tax=Streblomastix strix TaxID=222440 RepID=A0A5J4WSI6_9EUKA|nr:MAG: hypothetical protein EZS28_006575 [Streblomastix strix]
MRQIVKAREVVSIFEEMNHQKAPIVDDSFEFQVINYQKTDTIKQVRINNPEKFQQRKPEQRMTKFEAEQVLRAEYDSISTGEEEALALNEKRGLRNIKSSNQ